MNGAATVIAGTEPIDVAVGVLIRDDESFLLGQRPIGKPMEGYWEFPGGKREPGEAIFDALVREFDEELGLSIVAASPWVQRVVAYPHATVRLHFWRSFGEGRGWRGAPRGREAQAFCWERIDRSTVGPWLPGALPARRWLQLPPLYAISNATAMGIDGFCNALERGIDDGTVSQLLLREPAMDDAAFSALFDAVAPRCAAGGVRLLVHGSHPARFWSAADGVHLRARDLMAADARPAVDWCIASVHDDAELARAGALGFDAAVLGPVAPTTSHPGVDGIGWERFAAIASETTLPVYALGGLGAHDLDRARHAGGHGVAMIRGAWS